MWLARSSGSDSLCVSPGCVVKAAVILKLTIVAKTDCLVSCPVNVIYFIQLFKTTDETTETPGVI